MVHSIPNLFWDRSAAFLLPIWTSKHVTARKVRQRIGTVMRWAAAAGIPAGQPGRRRDHGGAAETPHDGAAPGGASPPGRSPRRSRDADAWVGTRQAFEFLVLTAARSAEVRAGDVGRDGGEMDLVALVWTVPGWRMKAKRAHRVAAVRSGRSRSLREPERLRGAWNGAADEGLVFPDRPGQGARRRDHLEAGQEPGHLGGAPWLPVVVRGTGRRNGRNHPREVVEAALAHAVRNQTEAAYARSDLFERRRQLDGGLVGVPRRDAWAGRPPAPRGDALPRHIRSVHGWSRRDADGDRRPRHAALDPDRESRHRAGSSRTW